MSRYVRNLKIFFSWMSWFISYKSSLQSMLGLPGQASRGGEQAGIRQERVKSNWTVSQKKMLNGISHKILKEAADSGLSLIHRNIQNGTRLNLGCYCWSLEWKALCIHTASLWWLSQSKNQLFKWLVCEMNQFPSPLIRKTDLAKLDRPTTKIYNYVLGGFGEEKKSRRKIKKRKKEKNSVQHKRDVKNFKVPGLRYWCPHPFFALSIYIPKVLIMNISFVIEKNIILKKSLGAWSRGQVVNSVHSTPAAQSFTGSDPGCGPGTADQAMLKQRPTCHN